MAIIKQQSTKTSQIVDEHILVVRRSVLFPNESWQGIKKVDFDHYIHIIGHQKEFYPRTIMEHNPIYKQIIPYLIFEHNNKFFLMQRKANASEVRLQNKYSLGIGGHIRKEDLDTTGVNPIFDWAKREFHEEIEYNGSLEIEPLGILNDDSNDVGKVHLGFVFLLHGNSDQISIKSELKSGLLVPLSACLPFKNAMESWSQFALEYLSRNANYSDISIND